MVESENVSLFTLRMVVTANFRRWVCLAQNFLVYLVVVLYFFIELELVLVKAVESWW